MTLQPDRAVVPPPPGLPTLYQPAEPAVPAFGSEHFFRALVENALDIIHVIDGNGVIRYITPSIWPCLGYAPDEVVGRHGSEWVHPEDVPRAQVAFDHDIRHPNSTRSIELRLRHKDGSWRTFEVTGKHPSDLPGFTGLIITSRDVTARRRTEAALRRNQHYLQQLFESAPEGIVLLDNWDRVIRANAEFTRIFGYEPADLEGHPINDLIVPDALRAEARELTERVAAGQAISSESVRRRKDGSLLHVSILGSPVRVDDGRVAVFGIYRDISDRKAMERQNLELLERERTARARAEVAEQRSAFLAEVSALLDASLDYHATLRNLARLAVPALADYCLIDEVEESGEFVRRVALAHVDPEREKMLFADARHPLDDDPERHPVIRVARTGKALLVPELTPALLDAIAHDSQHRAGLRTLGLRSFIIVPLIARGRTLGTITLAAAESGRHYGPTDLSMAEEVARRAALAVDNARLYGNAQQAIRAREKVLAFVSHDLRNPLATILLNASAILETHAPDQLDPWIREQLSWIERSTEQMNRLIEDLLEVTRIEAGRLTIEAFPLSAAPLVDEMLAMLRPLALDRNITLRAVRAPPDLPRVLGDHGRISQVFSNLIGNALKFTPEGGSITVGAEPCAEGVRFFVRDTGAGIAAEHIPHLFDRYWQAGRNSRGGAGLGLAISRGIVEAHGGRIWVESREGEGSTFFFTLPVGGGQRN